MCAIPSGASYRDWLYYFPTPAHRESTGACITCPYVGPACEGYARSPLQVVQYDIPAGVVYASTYVNDMNAAQPVGVTSTGTASMTAQGRTASASFDNAYHIGPCGGTPPISGALTLPVSALVGQPFHLSLSAQVTQAPQYGRAYVYGLLSFRDLPPGYAVTSCNGFRDLATRSVPRTWGSLKSLSVARCPQSPKR
jgi:hypothetical protein